MKLTKTGERRLIKLIEFLEQLPRESFDFSIIANVTRCGTVACAIGWTPKVFPKLVEWHTNYSYKTVHVIGDRLHRMTSIEFIVDTLFEIPRTAAAMFSPGAQELVHRVLPVLGSEASPKQVAHMLRKFIQLAKEGEIKC